MMNSPANGGVFAGAQPSAGAGAGTGTDQAPDQDPKLDPAPAPTPMTTLTVTESGLLEFVLQQAYAGVDQEEGDRIRAVLAPQYAILAQYLQGAFNGATQVEVPPDVLATPTPDPTVTTPDPAVSVTQSMAVVAVTALLNDAMTPSVSVAGNPAGVPPGVTDPVLAPFTATTSSLDLLVVDTQSFSTSVPEPSSMLLLASAGVALAWARKWKGLSSRA